MRVGPVLEWRDSLGTPATVGDTTITPLARSLIARWPGGGAVWSSPTAIMVEREGRVDRVPVVNVNRRILWGLRVSAAAFIATWIVRGRGRKDSNG